MTTAFDAIPGWDDRGLLPPYLGHQAATEDRSPYRVSLVDIVERQSEPHRIVVTCCPDFWTSGLRCARPG